MKKTPLRRCTGCREMKDKDGLLRVVSNEEGFSVDTTHKAPGRGAYVCKNLDCLLKAQKARGFERSFKSAVPICVYEQLKTELIMVESDK